MVCDRVRNEFIISLQLRLASIRDLRWLITRKKSDASARAIGMEKVRSPFSVRIECLKMPPSGSAVLIASARKTGNKTGSEGSNRPDKNTTIDARAVKTANGLRSKPYNPAKSSRAELEGEADSSRLRSPSRMKVPEPHVGSSRDWVGFHPAASITCEANQSGV